MTSFFISVLSKRKDAPALLFPFLPTAFPLFFQPALDFCTGVSRQKQLKEDPYRKAEPGTFILTYSV